MNKSTGSAALRVLPSGALRLRDAGFGDIVGATSSTYRVTSADVDKTLRVSVTGSNSGGSSSALSDATAFVIPAASYGYRDQLFTGAGEAPTGSKPESKLWWNDGLWWASMWDTQSASFHIFRLDTFTQTWSDTGTQIDNRAGTRGDALWDGSHLYIASHVFATCGCSTPSSGQPSRLYRYTYDSVTKSYTLENGFPVAINDTQTEALVIDKDSTGTVWATWVQGSQVYVNHTVGIDNNTFGQAFALPATGSSNLNSDDLSSVVAFGGNKIGVMWSNQTDAAMYFAVHDDAQPDTTWTATRTALQGPRSSDDHINLKSVQSDGGRIYAAIKTSLGDGPDPSPDDPLISLLVRDPNTGDWANYPYGRVSDDHTRAIVMIDSEHRVIHMFATAPVSGGTIYEKTSPLDAISFPVGPGTPFIQDPSSAIINDATSTKQNVNSTTGLAVLACDDATAGYYWHNYETLGP